MTPADNASTVREALNIGPLPDSQTDRDKLDAGHDSLDALQAQAERNDWAKDEAGDFYAALQAAEAERDRLQEAYDGALDRLIFTKAERDKWYGIAHDRLLAWRDEVAGWEAERDRLDDALERLVGHVAWFTDGDGSMAELVDAEKEARAALAGEDT